MEENRRALKTSLNILIKKNYSRKEIKKKLIGYTYSENAIDFALKELENLGFIDDFLYASQISEYYQNRGYGNNRIKQELYKRLLEKDIIDEIIGEIEVDYDKILVFYHQKLKGEVRDYNLIQKTKAFLVRKGFSYDEINDGFIMYKQKIDSEEIDF